MKVVLDSNVLWAQLLRDLLLELAFQERYEVFWCERILDALSRHLEPRMAEGLTSRLMEREAGLSCEQALDQARQVAHTRITHKLLPRMRATFPHAMVTDERWSSLLDVCENPEEDRHVLATAIACGASFIVTYNLKDFPPSALQPHGLVALSPDELLARLERAHLLKAIDAVSRRSKRSPRTREEIIEALVTRHACAILNDELSATRAREERPGADTPDTP